LLALLVCLLTMVDVLPGRGMLTMAGAAMVARRVGTCAGGGFIGGGLPGFELHQIRSPTPDWSIPQAKTGVKYER
jgi:hypothetical protein